MTFKHAEKTETVERDRVAIEAYFTTTGNNLIKQFTDVTTEMAIRALDVERIRLVEAAQFLALAGHAEAVVLALNQWDTTGVTAGAKQAQLPTRTFHISEEPEILLLMRAAIAHYPKIFQPILSIHIPTFLQKYAEPKTKEHLSLLANRLLNTRLRFLLLENGTWDTVSKTLDIPLELNDVAAAAIFNDILMDIIREQRPNDAESFTQELVGLHASGKALHQAWPLSGTVAAAKPSVELLRQKMAFEECWIAFMVRAFAQ